MLSITRYPSNASPDLPPPPPLISATGQSCSYHPGFWTNTRRGYKSLNCTPNQNRAMANQGKYVRAQEDREHPPSTHEPEEANRSDIDDESMTHDSSSEYSVSGNETSASDSSSSCSTDDDSTRSDDDEVPPEKMEVGASVEANTKDQANSVKESSDTSERMKQIEKVLADLSRTISLLQPSTTGNSTLRPVSPKADHTWNFAHEPLNAQSSYTTVRPEHIKPFPSGVRPNKMWAEWFDFIENFEIAVSLHNTNDPVYKVKLLYLSLGKELQAIVKATNLRPSLTDPNCYTKFVKSIEVHLRSMTDTVAEHQSFTKLKQGDNESAVAFHARLIRNVKLCGYSASDQGQFVRTQLLNGLRNDDLVKAARVYGYDTNFIVQSATRDETFAAETLERAPDTNVLRIDQRFESSRKRINTRQEPSFTSAKFRRTNLNYEQMPQRRAFPPKWEGETNFSIPRTQGRRTRCPRCNNVYHRNPQCPALSRTCDKCGKRGHFAITCRTGRLVQQVAVPSDIASFGEELSDDKQNVNALTLADATVNCSIGSANLIGFLVDSGADVNVPYNSLHSYASDKPMPVECTFRAIIGVPGTTKPSVVATFYVVPNGARSLLGRSTAHDLKLLQIGNAVNNFESVDAIFPKMPGVQVKFSVNKSIPPTKNAYYNVPAAFREAARARLHEMEKCGIIERVTKAPLWISGMSAVSKGKSDFRLVVNMRAPNKAINREYFRLPLLDEMRVKLHGAKYFSKLDLKNAFHHLELSEDSRDLTTFLAEDGMYRFSRLMFGVNCAPEIFQREMVRLFANIKNVIIYIDDILIFAENLKKLQQTVSQVLQILQDNNLTLNVAKCEYNKTSIKFLGHQLDGDGFHVVEEKIKSVRNFREPTTISELRSFLGLASYVSSYVGNFAEISRPLWEIVTKKTWTWDTQQKKSFELIKQRILHCTTALGFFSEIDKTILYTDASPNALGAVLVQESKTCTPRIISFASKALTETERKYAQNQREALSAVWGVEHFSYFLLGRHFTLRTDAQGVAFILNRAREESKRALTRADGWALRLSPYSYDVEYVRGQDNIADPSSRLYNGKDEAFDDETSPWETGMLEANSVEILTDDEIVHATSHDETLQLVVTALQSGDWSNVHTSYRKVRDDLSVRDGIIVKTGCAVIPPSLRDKALRVAHEGHPSIAKMKCIIRQRVWWPGMATNVQNWVESCETCATNGKPEKATPMQRVFIPKAVWETIAIDFNGPYVLLGGISILVIIDYRSRFLFAKPVKSTSFENTRKVLDEIFEKEGYPKNIKSDNGPPFNGAEYREYCVQRGIKPIFSTPLFPQQNGMVESSMKVVNKAISAAISNKTNYVIELREALNAHNSAAHSVTQLPPEEIMVGRKIRRGLPLIIRGKSLIDDALLDQRDRKAKLEGKRREDIRRGARECRVKVGDTVIIQRQLRTKGQSRFSPTRYRVTGENNGSLVLLSEDGQIIKRHITQTKRVFPWKNHRQTIDEKGVNPGNATAAGDRKSSRIKKAPAYLDKYVRPIEQ
ncbi:uncharacterized protein LOC128745955 [Sabethes cyaneus]|uniref:uncharacterized protein LOC128745955 n=1 Tax=Sabethes cyaneus TaxID=53552 RepID=UPI00237E55AA|nr:uncharacterized protein LOC128745955 [Sabethes cyaneus]